MRLPGGIRQAANATGGSPIVTRVDDAESDPGGGSVRSCSRFLGPGGDLRRRAGRGFRVRNAAGERIGMGIGRLIKVPAVAGQSPKPGVVARTDIHRVPGNDRPPLTDHAGMALLFAEIT